MHIVAESAAKSSYEYIWEGTGGGGEAVLRQTEEGSKRGVTRLSRPPKAMRLNYLHAVSTILAMPLPSVQHFLPAELGWQIL